MSATLTPEEVLSLLTDETTGLIAEGDPEWYDMEVNDNADKSENEPRRREVSEGPKFDRLESNVFSSTQGRVREDADSTSDAGQRSGSRRPRRRSGSEDEDALNLQYGARHLLLLIVPVSLCMLVVVTTVLSVTSYTSEDAKLYVIDRRHENSLKQREASDPAHII